MRRPQQRHRLGNWELKGKLSGNFSQRRQHPSQHVRCWLVSNESRSSVREKQLAFGTYHTQKVLVLHHKCANWMMLLNTALILLLGPRQSFPSSQSSPLPGIALGRRWCPLAWTLWHTWRPSQFQNSLWHCRDLWGHQCSLPASSARGPKMWHRIMKGLLTPSRWTKGLELLSHRGEGWLSPLIQWPLLVLPASGNYWQSRSYGNIQRRWIFWMAN